MLFKTFIAFVIAASSTVSVLADSIELRNGRTIQGDVIAEDGQTITVEVFSMGNAIDNRIQKDQIAKWDRPPHNGPAYVVIPVMGVIGPDPTGEKFISANALRAGLDAARALHPRYIVLGIDSPGGSVSELDEMLEALGRVPKDSEVIAYVKTAYSAAAVLAMSCHRIYMRPNAVIGACVPFETSGDAPKDVDAKFRSALEAKQRAIITQAGHNGLFLMGMAETDTEIYLTHDSGQPELNSVGPGKLIKAKGQILTLTADEAQDCGLAHIVSGLPDIAQQTAGGEWYEASKRPWNAVIGVADAERRKIARAIAMERIGPALADLNSQIQPLVARWNGDRNAIRQLWGQYQNQFISPAQYQRSVNPYQTDAAALNGEISTLVARRKDLIDTLPN